MEPSFENAFSDDDRYFACNGFVKVMVRPLDLRSIEGISGWSVGQ